MKNIIYLYKEMAKDIAEIMHEVFADFDIGENIKVHKNTLKGSNLDTELQVNVVGSDSPFLQLVINDYYQYVERGREPKHTPKVPIDALRDWARRKLGRTDNRTLFLVQRSIYEKGIRPRPIFHYFWERLDDKWENEYAEKLFEILTEDLNKYFKD